MMLSAWVLGVLWSDHHELRPSFGPRLSP